MHPKDLGSGVVSCGILTTITLVAMHIRHGHKARMNGPPA